PDLRDSVQLMGRLPHAAVEDFLNSADFLLLSSVHEGGSTYAVLEAMSCGVIPVLTDIQSFRAMTGEGKYGLLFPVGNDCAMADIVLAFDRRELESKAQQVHDYFKRALSFDAIAAIYEDVFRSACLVDS